MNNNKISSDISVSSTCDNQLQNDNNSSNELTLDGEAFRRVVVVVLVGRIGYKQRA